MPTIIEMNVQTGIVSSREMTPQEIAAIPPQVTQVPQVIDALQGLLALDHEGMSSYYETWANAPERTFAQKAFISKALHWRRDDPTLNIAARDLGLTSENIDSLFQLAITL